MVYTSNITIISASTTLTTQNDVYLVNASGGAITITLPNITCDGIQYNFKRTDTSSNIVTIQGFSVGQTIDGSVSVPLYTLSNATVHSYNSVWYLLAYSIFNASLSKTIFTSAFVNNNGTSFINFTGSKSTPQIICAFFYPGSNIVPISRIIGILGNGGGTPVGTVSVIVQGGATIGTITITGITGANGQIYTTSTISNLPTGPTVLEYYVTITSGGGAASVNVYSLIIQ